MSRELTIADRTRTVFLAPIESDLQSAMPSTVNPQRFQAAFITAAQNSPVLFRCAPESVRNALMKCASDGLVPDGRQAAIVPFKDGSGTMMAQYIPMVQGILTRARELGAAFSITANCVYGRDEFVVDETDLNSMTHKRPALGSDRGEVLGAYVIFRDRDGRVIHREIMDKAEITKSRNVSRAKNSPAWNNWFGEMARKTVIRRGAKYVPMSDTLRQIIEREDEHVSFIDRAERPSNYNPLIEAEAIDAETGEITDPSRDTSSQAEEVPGTDTYEKPSDSVVCEIGQQSVATDSVAANEKDSSSESVTDGSETGAPRNGANGAGAADAPVSEAPAPAADWMKYHFALQRAATGKGDASLKTLDRDFAKMNPWLEHATHRAKRSAIYRAHLLRIKNDPGFAAAIKEAGIA